MLADTVHNSTATATSGFEDYVELTRDTGYVPLLTVVLFGIFSHCIVLPLCLVFGARRGDSSRATHEGSTQEGRLNIHGEETPTPEAADGGNDDREYEYAFDEEDGVQIITTVGSNSFSLTEDEGKGKEVKGNDGEPEVKKGGPPHVHVEWTDHLADEVFALPHTYIDDKDSGGDTDNYEPSDHDDELSQATPLAMFDAEPRHAAGRKQRLERMLVEEARYSILQRDGEKRCWGGVFLVLLEPQTRKFEIIRVTYNLQTATIGHILENIKVRSTVPALRCQTYVSLIRPIGGIADEADEDVATEVQLDDLNMLASDSVSDNEVLIPVPKDFSITTYQHLANKVLKLPSTVELLAKEGPSSFPCEISEEEHLSDADNPTGMSARCPGHCMCSLSSWPFNDFAKLCRYDNETKRILRLAIPFTISDLVDSVADIISLSLISLHLGPQALSAYVVTETLIEITSEFAGGVIDCEYTVLGHAYGAGNNKLVGQYVQLCTVFYVVLMIPFVFMWSFATYDIMIWMGFDAIVAQLAQDYGRIVVCRDVLEGVSDTLDGFLEIVGKEVPVAVIGYAHTLFELGAVVMALLLFGGDLITVGAIGLIVEVVFLILRILLSHCMGWIRPFTQGIFGSLAIKNHFAVRQVIRTATPLAFGSVLVYGEWEIMTLFAAYLGPAEVTAWAVLGELWDLFETSSEGIGNAAEVRVAYHCGKNRPEQAKISAYKSILIGVPFSVVITSIFLILGNDIPGWLTSDPTLQRMISENIPLMGVGNIIMTAGSICWAEVGAQGRYRLATIVLFVSSWFVAIPLAAASVYGLFLDLRGLTASVCIGFLCATTVLVYILLRSDWVRLSQSICDMNAVTGLIDSSDDEDSSVASSSSSSSASSSSSSSSSNSSSSSSSCSDICT